MTKTKTYDCLIIGYNDLDFEQYLNILKSMGTDHSDYRDLRLNYIDYQGKPYRAADLLTLFNCSGQEKPPPPLTNHDVLWMCVTYLGTYLKKHGFSFDYINLFHYQKDELREKLTHNRYLSIAITTTIYNFEHPILDVISFIKRYNQTSPLIVGGPYISKRSERLAERDLKAFFKYMGADYYVCSREGEKPMVEILKAMKNNSGFHTIENIAFKENDEFLITSSSLELNPLEENPIDYSLFPPEDIGAFVNVRTSKGCPYRCSFCGFPQRAEKYKYASVDYIKQELDALRKVGTVTHLHFTDDTFNVPKNRMKELMKVMIREKYNFKWNCYFRCDHMDEEMVGLMKEAGCVGVFLGLESANQTVLKNMNKQHAGKEFYRQAVPLFKNAGIATFISIFIGFPGETFETFWETIEFLRETGADFHRPQLWYCDTLTPIWQDRERFGLSGNHFAWSHDTMDAAAALDLQEESLLALDAPVWVPDPGYNYTGVYHMEQRGLSFEHQKLFLRFFGAIVKEKLLFPDLSETSPALLKGLEQTARLDCQADVDLSPLESLSDTAYLAARTYFLKHYSEPLPPSPLQNSQAKLQSGRQESPLYSLDPALVAALSNHYGDDLTGPLLAALVLVTQSGNKANAPDDRAIITVAPGGRPVPVRLKPQPDMPLDTFISEVQQQYESAADHQLFALYFLTHKLRKREQPNWSFVVDTGFRRISPNHTSLDLNRCLSAYPPAGPGLALTLDLIETEQGFSFRFHYAASAYDSFSAGKLANRLIAGLQTAAGHSQTPLNQIKWEAAPVRRNKTVEIHAQKSFNF